jgi:hypothetical protein
MKMTGTVMLGCGSVSRYVILNFIIQLDLATELLSVAFSVMTERVQLRQFRYVFIFIV